MSISKQKNQKNSTQKKNTSAALIMMMIMAKEKRKWRDEDGGRHCFCAILKKSVFLSYVYGAQVL